MNESKQTHELLITSSSWLQSYNYRECLIKTTFTDTGVSMNELRYKACDIIFYLRNHSLWLFQQYQ